MEMLVLQYCQKIGWDEHSKMIYFVLNGTYNLSCIMEMLETVSAANRV